MRQFRTQSGEKHAGCRDAEHGRQIDEAQTPVGQLRFVPADHHETQRPGDRDRQAARRGSCHRLLHRHAAPGQVGYRQRPAANAENRRRPADHHAHQRQLRPSRRLAGGLGPQVEPHLHRHRQGEHTDDLLQHRPLDRRGSQAAQGGAKEDAKGHPQHHRPAHRTLAVMGENGIDRGENDGSQGRTDGQMGEDFLRESLRAETEYQHRYDDQPAAHAKQPGQHSGEAAKQQIQQKLHVPRPGETKRHVSGKCARPARPTLTAKTRQWLIRRSRLYSWRSGHSLAFPCA